MSACTRCGIDCRAELCRDCLDVLTIGGRRETYQSRLAHLIKQRDELDKEIRSLTFAAKPGKKRRPRNIKPDCGTESGYQWHRYRGEKCEPCRAAHAEHERQARTIRLANNRKKDVA